MISKKILKIITEGSEVTDGEHALKEAAEGAQDTSDIIKATAEEKKEEGASAQEEVRVDPEVDDRKKEEKSFDKEQEKEQEKMHDSTIEESTIGTFQGRYITK